MQPGKTETEIMAQAGFDSVFIGIESTDETSLSECHKTQNKNRNLLEHIRAPLSEDL